MRGATRRAHAQREVGRDGDERDGDERDARLAQRDGAHHVVRVELVALVGQHGRRHRVEAIAGDDPAARRGDDHRAASDVPSEPGQRTRVPGVWTSTSALKRPSANSGDAP